MKNINRIVLSTLAAAAITANAVIPASAAQEKPAAAANRGELHTQILLHLQEKFGTHSWLWDLICNWNPGCSTPEEKPEVPEEKPEIPEEAPDSPMPDLPKPEVPDTPVPDLPTPEVPDTPMPDTPTPEVPDTPVPEQKPEIDGPSSTVHAYERRVVELVNVERAKHGRAALTLSEDLCEKARIKSRDMAVNNYFSHNSPTYGTPFEMMKALGVSYRSAGENIAMGYATPEAVVTAWMNSQGHRENILSTKYTTLGVGYIADGGYWTQWFIG